MTEKRVPTKCRCGGALKLSEVGRKFVIKDKAVVIEDARLYVCETCDIGVTDDGHWLYDALKYEYDRLKRMEESE